MTCVIIYSNSDKLVVVHDMSVDLFIEMRFADAMNLWSQHQTTLDDIFGFDDDRPEIALKANPIKFVHRRFVDSIIDGNVSIIPGYYTWLKEYQTTSDGIEVTPTCYV